MQSIKDGRPLEIVVKTVPFPAGQQNCGEKENNGDLQEQASAPGLHSTPFEWLCIASKPETGLLREMLGEVSRPLNSSTAISGGAPSRK